MPWSAEAQRRHQRVYKACGKASEYLCIDCDNKARDWSQIHGTSGELPEHYEPRCVSCHRKYDNNEEWQKRISASMMGNTNRKKKN